MEESETDLIPPSKTPGQFHMPQGRQIPLKIIFIYAKFVADSLSGKRALLVIRSRTFC
jgi:hypothetical protein